MRNDRKIRRVRNSQSKAIKRSRARRVTLTNNTRLLCSLVSTWYARALAGLPQESFAELVDSLSKLATKITKFLEKRKK